MENKYLYHLKKKHTYIWCRRILWETPSTWVLEGSSSSLSDADDLTNVYPGQLIDDVPPGIHTGITSPIFRVAKTCGADKKPNASWTPSLDTALEFLRINLRDQVAKLTTLCARADAIEENDVEAMIRTGVISRRIIRSCQPGLPSPQK